MKTMYFKLGNTGNYNYCARMSSDIGAIEITNIPDEETVNDILILLHKTGIWKAKSIEYSQLGEGKLIKRNTLTPTETKIAELIVSEKLTNRQLGERLGIAEGTIRTHVSRILVKLNLKSRKEM